jgi:hypothetical protein
VLEKSFLAEVFENRFSGFLIGKWQVNIPIYKKGAPKSPTVMSLFRLS